MSKNNKNAAKIRKKRTNRGNRTPGVNRTKKVNTKRNTWFAKLAGKVADTSAKPAQTSEQEEEQTTEE